MYYVSLCHLSPRQYSGLSSQNLKSQNLFVFKFAHFLCVNELQVVCLSPFVLLFPLKHIEKIRF